MFFFFFGPLLLLPHEVLWHMSRFKMYILKRQVSFANSFIYWMSKNFIHTTNGNTVGWGRIQLSHCFGKCDILIMGWFIYWQFLPQEIYIEAQRLFLSNIKERHAGCHMACLCFPSKQYIFFAVLLNTSEQVKTAESKRLFFSLNKVSIKAHEICTN